MFKYLPLQFADQLAEVGGFRMGTLHDFRKSEHGRGIGDRNEGRKSVRHYIDHLRVTGSDDPASRNSINARAFQEFGVLRVSGSAKVTFSNTWFRRTFNAPDCYVYCLSSVKSREVLAEFEGADACVEIIEPTGFFRAMTRALNLVRPVEFKGYFEVSYAARMADWNGHDWGTHPALLKGLEYRQQHEMRAIWTPLTSEAIEPLITGDIELPRFCRQVQLPG